MSSLERIIATVIAAALILPFGAAPRTRNPRSRRRRPPRAPKKATPHSHSEMNKQGAPSAVPDQSAPPKKQGHKHSDWK